MKRITKQLIENLKYIKGTILGIGLDEEISSLIKDRDNIQNFYTINHGKNKKDDTIDSDNLKKNFSINKMYKYFDNKEIDYTICNLDVLDRYFPHLIRDIININDEQLFFYGSTSNFDVNILVKQLERYKTKVDKIDCGEYFLIIVDTKDAEVKYSSRFVYFIKDTLMLWIDKIGNVLTK